MRGINYTAGFGVILVFAGIYCFKALVSKNRFVNKEGETIHSSMSAKNRAILVVSGILFVIAGLLLIVMALPDNST